jgi:hypothetical protein
MPRGAGGMGPCPPQQHQPPGGVYTHGTSFTKKAGNLRRGKVESHHIRILYYVYIMYIQSIYIVYPKIIL